LKLERSPREREEGYIVDYKPSVAQDRVEKVRLADRESAHLREELDLDHRDGRDTPGLVLP